jgi:3-oxoadipate enol-lactonase
VEGLYVERRGEGEPLLLIQGLSGNSLHWGERFLAGLERDFELVLYDHRGVGRSPRVTEPFTIAELAEDALGVLDREGIARAHVLGISMGGMVAQELALRAPERLRTLTLGCTSCGGDGARLIDEGVIRVLGEAMASGDADRAIRTSYEVNVSPGYGADHSHYATWYEVAAAYPAPVPLVMLQLQAIRAHDASARLGEIAAPTLVVHGAVDQVLGVENGRMIARLIPGARLEELAGVGHMFFWERPEESAGFVREHTRTATA